MQAVKHTIFSKCHYRPGPIYYWHFRNKPSQYESIGNWSPHVVARLIPHTSLNYCSMINIIIYIFIVGWKCLLGTVLRAGCIALAVLFLVGLDRLYQRLLASMNIYFWLFIEFWRYIITILHAQSPICCLFVPGCMIEWETVFEAN